MKKIVLTGGPCAGKTSVVQAVQQHFGEVVSFVPEVATMLLSSGWPLPGRDIDWTPNWRDTFQRAIVTTQRELEDAYELTARQHDQQLLLTDRGIMDGAAYHPSNRAFLEATNTDHEAALSRYTAVVHLESIAVANPSLYSRGNNPYRYEDLDEAISLEAATRRAWLDHPQHVVIEGDDLTHKTQTVLQLIQEVLDNDSL